MEILATIVRSYKKFWYGMNGTIHGSWKWFPRKINPGIQASEVVFSAKAK